MIAVKKLKLINKVFYLLRYINLRARLFRQVSGKVKLEGNLEK